MNRGSLTGSRIGLQLLLDSTHIQYAQRLAVARHAACDAITLYSFSYDDSKSFSQYSNTLCLAQTRRAHKQRPGARIASGLAQFRKTQSLSVHGSRNILAHSPTFDTSARRHISLAAVHQTCRSSVLHGPACQPQGRHSLGRATHARAPPPATPSWPPACVASCAALAGRRFVPPACRRAELPLSCMQDHVGGMCMRIDTHTRSGNTGMDRSTPLAQRPPGEVSSVPGPEATRGPMRALPGSVVSSGP